MTGSAFKFGLAFMHTGFGVMLLGAVLFLTASPRKPQRSQRAPRPNDTGNDGAGGAVTLCVLCGSPSAAGGNRLEGA